MAFPAKVKEAEYELLQPLQPMDIEDSVPKRRTCSSRWKSFKSKILAALNILLFGFSVTSLVFSYHLIKKERSSNQRFRAINNYSPILERLDLPLHNHTMDGYLFDVSHSLFRGEPSPEVNAEWDRVSMLGPMVFGREEVAKIGKNPKNVVKLPPSWGYGEDAYIWQFESQHNIHCLNFLRQYAYFDHFYGAQGYAKFEDTPKLDRIHLSHCFYYLLQDLRCLPSFNPLTFNWMDGWKTPHTDFNLHRQCIDHERLLEWQLENKIEYKGKAIPKPPPGDRRLMHGPMGMQELLEEGEDLEHGHGVDGLWDK